MKRTLGPLVLATKFIPSFLTKHFLLAILILVTSARLLSAQSLQEPVEPVNVILDSDLAHSVDDVGDHAMLWALSARGEVNVLALIVSATNDYSAPTARAIATYYGHPNVLIGANLGDLPDGYASTDSSYTQQMVSQFGTAGDVRTNYPSAVTAYRQALASAPDHSVYIVNGGFFRPMYELLQSGPDSISSLTGVQLVAQKVRRAVLSAGGFPDSGGQPHLNLETDPDSAAYVVANWPTEIIWIGYDEGWNVMTGPAANADPNSNPIKLAYNLACNNGQWCANNAGAWTQIALLYAIRGGLGSNFSVGGQDGSTVVWDSTTAIPGRSIWSQSPDRQNAYLLRAIPAPDMANILNPLVQWLPTAMPVLSSVTLTPNSIIGGNAATGSVMLSSAAPAGGIQVALTSSNTAVVTLPQTLSVLSGSNAVTFSVTTTAVSVATPVTISATYHGVTVTAQLLVQPIPLSDQTITFAPLPSATYGDPAFTVSASASSGLAVTFTVGAASNCSISGSLLTLTAAGTCTVTAHQAGDAHYNPAPDLSQTFSIAKATATVQLTGLTATYDGTPKQVTATTSPANLVVSITYNSSTTAPTNTGNYAVAATINDNNYQGSATGTLSINSTTTAVLLTSSRNPSVYGQSVSFTAVVSSSAGTPTGSVTFYDGVTALGAATLSGTGYAVLSTSVLSAATHSITAAYAGGLNFQGSTSPGLFQVVKQVATATTLTSSPNPSTFNQAVTLTATVSAGNSVPSGTVTFSDGSKVLGSSQTSGSGIAVLTVSTLAVGSHSLTAAYSVNGNWLGSTSPTRAHTVNKGSTTTALTSSLNPSSPGKAVALTAAVTGSGAVATGTIQFLDGSTTLATITLDANGRASYITSTLAAGTHTLRAIYSGNANFLTSTSGSLSQIVLATTTSTLTSSRNPSSRGQSVTFTATVTSTIGTPTGTVTFKDGTTVLGSANLNGSGHAVYSTSSLARGTHSITATYGGSTSFLTSTSAALNQQVNNALLLRQLF